MNLFLVRHGEIPSNVNKVYAGRSPEELTTRGIAQAKEIADKLISCNIHSIYSSPVRRANQTAEIISRKIGIPVVVHNALGEMELGPWEGLSEADIEKTYSEEWKLWNTRPAELKMAGRETLEELLSRVLKGLRSIRAGKSENIVIVTHVAIVRVLLLWHAKASLNLYKTIHVPNAGIFQIKTDFCPSP